MQPCQRLSRPFVGSVEAVSDCRVVLCMCPYQVTVQDAFLSVYLILLHPYCSKSSCTETVRWKDTREVILSQANQERPNAQIYDVLPALHSSRPKLVSREVLDARFKSPKTEFSQHVFSKGVQHVATRRRFGNVLLTFVGRKAEGQLEPKETIKGRMVGVYFY